MNKIILIGRLTKDPELRYSPSGTAVSRFTIAVPRETEKNKADFFYCTAFGKLAISLAEYCKQGRQLLVEGRIEINQSTDQQTGISKTFTNLIANSVEFLAKPQHQENNLLQQTQQTYQQQNNQQTYNKEQLMNAYNNRPLNQQSMFNVQSELPYQHN